MRERMTFHLGLCIALMIFLAFTTLPVFGASTSTKTSVAAKKPLVFDNLRSQTKEFIGYYQSIRLDEQQTKLKERVLSSIPAPCCKDYSVLTCCCPCNLAKSVWGLSHYLIAKRAYDAAPLKKAVLDWMKFVNPGGFTGDACYVNRCGSAFAANGCGGMKEDHIIY